MAIRLRGGGLCTDTQHVVGDDFAGVLADAQGGSDDQFAVLWRDANPALLRYLRVLAPENAEDIAAETWVHVVRSLDRFTGDEAAWRAWLFTTARRRLLDQARMRKRHPSEPLDEISAADLPSAPDAAQLAMDNIATEGAIALLSRLPGPAGRGDPAACGRWAGHRHGGRHAGQVARQHPGHGAPRPQAPWGATGQSRCD